MANQIIKAGKSTRYEWSDRNPLAKHISVYTGPIAPHAETERASYTIPTGKKAKINGAGVWLSTITTASTPGRRYVAIKVTNGGITHDMLLGIIDSTNNTAGKEVHNQITQAYTLLAGEKISIFTADLSTGGTTSLYGAVLITEYDEE